MKKVLLFVLLLTSVVSYADVQLEAEFDFNNPTQLNPPVVPSDLNNTSSSVFNKVFTNGPISISFEKGLNYGGVASILTKIDEFTNKASYQLQISKGVVLTIKSSDGAVLDSLRFSKNSNLGGLGLKSGEPGTRIRNFWKSDSKEVTSVSYLNGSSGAYIDQLTVYYSVPSEVLTPTASITDGSVIESFSSMSLYFNKTMSVKDASGIRITGPNVDKKMSASASGSTIKLSVSPTITEEGTYTITIPAGSFKSSEGYTNSALTYTFTISAPRNTFTYVSVTPANNSRLYPLPEIISVKFSEDVELENVGPFKMYKNGSAKYTVRLSVNENDRSVVDIKNSHGDITEGGVYTIEIPEKAIHNPFLNMDPDDRWNPSFTLRFTVDESLKPEPPDTDSDTMKAAKALLQKNGVGYPTANAASRTALKALTEASEVPSDEDLLAAMDAFYNETDLSMPVVGSWYSIASVNFGGSKLYLSYNNGAAALSTSNAKSAFKVNSFKDGVIVFETSDGKFLHLPSASNDYVGTSDKNVTDKKSYINNLTIAKLNVEGVEASKLMGLFSIFGALGNNNSTGEPESAYALVEFGSGKIVTQSGETTLHFENSLSSAFMFEETSEPSAPQAIDPKVSLSQTVISYNTDTFILKFDNVENVFLDDYTKPYFAKDAAGKTKASSTAEMAITGIENSTNQFVVHPDGLPAGATYYLILPKGTFSYARNEQPVNDIDLKVLFEIEPDETPVEPDIPEVTLSSTSIQTGSNLTITISNVKSTTLKNSGSPYFMQNGQRVSGATLTANGTNTFTVNASSLAVGSYTLVIPAGTFSYEPSTTGSTVDDIELTCSFDVKSSGSTPSSLPNFNQKYDMYGYNLLHRIEVPSDYAADVDLNDFVLFTYVPDYYTDLVPDPNKEVKLVRFYGGAPVKTGHFVAYKNFAKDYPDYADGRKAIRLVLDEPFEKGELDYGAGLYAFEVPAAAFGDANFAKYLKNPSSVKPENCIVNPEDNKITYQVNNRYAAMAGIKEIPSDFDDGLETIYDLTGRRVEKISKSGVYIVNGKKVFVK